MNIVEPSDTDIEKTLATLCESLEAELERQENLLAVCRALSGVVCTHDIVGLEAKTAAIEVLIRDAIRAEPERRRLLKELVELLGLPLERQTLTDLIKTVAEPWASRMSDFQRRIRDVMTQNASVVHQNGSLIRRSLRVIMGALNAIQVTAGNGAEQYDLCGMTPSSTDRPPALIDQKG